MRDAMRELCEVIEYRKSHRQEGSYTCYLFDSGLDKILKKCAEECGEVIIAAKNGDNAELTAEVCDLLYHIFVLLSQKGIPLSEIEALLERRAKKQGNLKQPHSSDKDS